MELNFFTLKEVQNLKDIMPDEILERIREFRSCPSPNGVKYYAIPSNAGDAFIWGSSNKAFRRVLSPENKVHLGYPHFMFPLIKNNHMVTGYLPLGLATLGLISPQVIAGEYFNICIYSVDVFKTSLKRPPVKIEDDIIYLRSCVALVEFNKGRGITPTIVADDAAVYVQNRTGFPMNISGNNCFFSVYAGGAKGLYTDTDAPVYIWRSDNTTVVISKPWADSIFENINSQNAGVVRRYNEKKLQVSINADLLSRDLDIVCIGLEVCSCGLSNIDYAYGLKRNPIMLYLLNQEGGTHREEYINWLGSRNVVVYDKGLWQYPVIQAMTRPFADEE